MSSRPNRLTPPRKKLAELRVSEPNTRLYELYDKAGFKTKKKQDRKYKSKKASDNLRLPAVAAYVKELQLKATEKAIDDTAEILQEFKRLGFSDIKTYLETLKSGDLDDLLKIDTRAIQSVKQRTRHVMPKDDRDPYTESITEIKLHPKIPALEKLAEMAGMIKKKDDKQGDNERVKLVVNIENILPDDSTK